MWRTSLATLLCGSFALGLSSGDPKNPFPGPPVNDPAAARWSTFWWADFDGDGALDVLVLHPSAPARLYKNAGAARFEDVTQASGLSGLTGARQALWEDFDGDGRLDLFLVVPGGQSRLFLAAEGGTFEDSGAASGMQLGESVLFAQALDYDGDGRTDLLLVTAERERVLRNLGAGLFEEVRLELPPRAPAAPSFDAAGVPAGVSAAAGTELSARGPSGRDDSGRAAASAAGPGPSATGTLNNNPMVPASASFACSSSVEDFANPGICIEASSVPMIGKLYPISSTWFVSPIGRVGIGTTSPAESLHVVGRIQASAQILTQSQFISTTAGAPLSVTSSVKVNNLNVDLLDGLDSTDFRLVADSIGTADIANLAVTTAKIADGNVTSAKLADNAVSSAKLQSNSVTTAKIADGNVTSAKLADGAVTSAKLATGAIGSGQLAANSVSTTHIVDGTIVNADVSASAAIQGTKILPNFGSQNVVTTGRGGFGTSGPNSTLHVNSPAGDDAFRVQNAGATKFLVASGGGVTVGTNFTAPPTDGLYVHGDAGIGVTSPTAKLHVINSANALDPVAGRFVSNGHNTAIGLDVTGRAIGIQAKTTDTSLNYAGYFETPGSGGAAAVRGVSTSSGGLAYGGRFEAASNTGAGGIGVLGWATANSGTNYGVYGQTNSSSGYAGYFFGGRNYFQGNVGIGVTNPSFQLHLSANSAAKPTSNTWTISSDERLKTDIQTIDGALSDLLALRGVTYRWKDPASQGGMDGVYTGFIAQEVERVFPEWIDVDPDGFKRLTVIGFEGLVVEALRELAERHDADLARLREEQAAELASAQSRVAELEAVVAAQAERMDRIAAQLALLLGEVPAEGR